MRIPGPLLAMARCVATDLIGAECGSAIQVRGKRKEGRVHLFAKNTSNRPVIAYVLASDEKSVDGSPTRVYYGVYSSDDALGAGKSVEIDVRRNAADIPNLSADYVRLADGWSCGSTLTQEARRIAARFQP
jgi:hypothetical protein